MQFFSLEGLKKIRTDLKPGDTLRFEPIPLLEQLIELMEEKAQGKKNT